MSLETRVERLEKQHESLYNTIHGLTRAMADIKHIALKNQHEIIGVTVNMSGIQTEITCVKEDISNLAHSTLSGFEHATEMMGSSHKLLDDMGEHLDTINTRLDETNKLVDGTHERVDETYERLNETNERLSDSSEKLEEAREQMEESNDQLNHNNKWLGGISQRLEGVENHIKEIRQEIKSLGELLKKKVVESID